MKWKLTAWNGIQFRCPEDWEVNQLASNFLSIGNNSGPKMEIKWDRIKGKFDPKLYLIRLKKHFKEKIKSNATLTPIPVIWEKAVCRFESAGFMWQEGALRGKGVLLYCKYCQRVILVQFYFEKVIQNKRLHEKILDSLRDHRNDNFLLWSVFGFQLSMPREYILSSHRFEAGSIEMIFKYKGSLIKIFRWGPADILLSDKDLKAFAADKLSLPDTESVKIQRNGYSKLEWKSNTSLKLWTRLKGRILSEPLFQWTRIWQLKEKNRIMGVSVSAPSPIESGALEHICNHYESV